MTRRFEGAITTPDEPAADSTRSPRPERPRRPLSIEISAAVLIVGGVSTLVGTSAELLSGGSAAADAGARPVVALILALNAVTVLIGVLVRRGLAWLLCVNVVAVLVFLELTAIPSGSAMAWPLAILDGFVFVALVRHRAWFDWCPAGEIPAR